MDDAETLLADLFEDRWPRDRNCYVLNVALQCKPWWPPLATVWQRRELGPAEDWACTAYASAWPEALRLVEELHRKYEEAHEHD